MDIIILTIIETSQAILIGQTSRSIILKKTKTYSRLTCFYLKFCQLSLALHVGKLC